MRKGWRAKVGGVRVCVGEGRREKSVGGVREE